MGRDRGKKRRKREREGREKDRLSGREREEPLQVVVVLHTPLSRGGKPLRAASFSSRALRK